MPLGEGEAEAGEPKRMRHVKSEIARVHEFADAMRGSDLVRMGRLLDESHRSLREDFEVSTPGVDALVSEAIQIDGCVGARIMGAGFGGSVLALVHREAVDSFVASVDRPVLICSTADGAYVR